MRLQRAIAESGLCSRRKAEELIEHGHVRVNGQVARLGMDVTQGDKILVKGEELRPQPKVYLVLHKPAGYITTASDPYGRRHVLQLIREPVRVFPVGRLDRDTTGMLLLTNDGEFANRIMHPRFEVRKTYEATLRERITDEELARLNTGVLLDGRRVKAFVRRLNPKRVEITVHTGMNKEVKRLFKRVGHWVVALKRTAINGVRLTVKEGRYRRLTEEELRRLSS